MLRTWLLASFLLLIVVAPAAVVINEVLYDPEGEDTGKEWIELYNNGENSVNLQGATLETGGSSFTGVFTLPYFILRPGRYLLIGGAQVPEATFQANLALQNGGSETDGIRYVAPDGLYTDTVLYDSLNTNGLPDDTGLPGSSFAPDVPAGYSLARQVNGLDTDASGADFLPCAMPSPGLPNPVPCDYAIARAEALSYSQFSPRVEVLVQNLSGFSPVHPAELLFYYDDLLQDSREIAPLAPGDSLLCTFEFSYSSLEDHELEFVLELPGDPNPENNRKTLDLWGLATYVLLSELMYYPQAGKPEWVELELDGPTPRAGTYRLEDASGNSCEFSVPNGRGFYVLVSDSTGFVNAHPDCPSSRIIRTNIPSLNNDGDCLRLYQCLQDSLNLIDSISYSVGSTVQGYSLEKVEESDYWRQSISETGSSPGRENQAAQPPPPEISGRLAILGSPFDARAGEELQIVYDLPGDNHTANCYVFDQAGRRKRVLASGAAIASQGYLLWDGRDQQGRYLPPGLYFILWESRSSSGKIYRRQTTAILSGH